MPPPAAPPVPPEVQYAPYGILPAGIQEWPETYPVPTDWVAPAGEDRKAHFDLWLQGVQRDLVRCIWPAWVGGRWVGDSDRNKHALTVADLELLDRLRPTLFAHVRTAAPNDIRHTALFLVEDKNVTQETLAAYAPALAKAGSMDFGAVWVSGAHNKVGSISTALKRNLQRPRPWQVALQLARPYRYNWATSANTPAIISGHAVQGIIGAATAYESLLSGGHVSGAERQALEQIAVDIGDRRVFAGVHYPTDNVASWIVALRMARFTFREVSGVREFLASAIERSQVHESIRESASAAFEPALALLDEALAA